MSTLPTPITDQVCEDYKGPLCMIGDVQFIPADFARQLERELADANAALTTSTERLTLELREAKAERDALKAEIAPLREIVGVRCDAESNPSDITNWLNLVSHADAAKKWKAAADGFEFAVQQERNIHMTTIAERDRWRAVADGLAEALEKISKDIPACDQNGQLYVLHFDGEGNELGQEFVDPVALCGHLSARIEEALARYRAASADGHARKEEA